MKNQLKQEKTLIFKNSSDGITCKIYSLKTKSSSEPIIFEGLIHINGYPGTYWTDKSQNYYALFREMDEYKNTYIQENLLEFNLKKSKDFQLLPKIYPAQLFEEYIYKLEVQNEISCCRVLIVRLNSKRVYNTLESSLSIGIFDEVVLERSQAFIKNVKDWNDLKTIVKAITGQNI